jgi:hypothetical protein
LEHIEGVAAALLFAEATPDGPIAGKEVAALVRAAVTTRRAGRHRTGIWLGYLAAPINRYAKLPGVDDTGRSICISSVRLAAAFRTAVETGDTQTLQRLSVEDAVLYTDGGERPAALNPISGATSFCACF